MKEKKRKKWKEEEISDSWVGARTRARWKQKCGGFCDKWVRAGRMIYRVDDAWMCHTCAATVDWEEFKQLGRAINGG